MPAPRTSQKIKILPPKVPVARAMGTLSLVVPSCLKPCFAFLEAPQPVQEEPGKDGQMVVWMGGLLDRVWGRRRMVGRATAKFSTIS